MTKRTSVIFAFFVLCAFAMISCKSDEEGNNNKPKARGATGEILLVIDSLKYKGPVGEELQDIFTEDIKGLIRSESLFDVRKVDPRSMTRILKMAYNIVYVTTFDDNKPGSRMINSLFSEKSKEKAASDPSLFMMRSEDEFAQGQEVVYLFGNTEEQLIKNLQQNKDKLQNLFEVRERKRLSDALLARPNGKVEKKGEELFNLDLNIPASYQFVQDDDDFLWVRQPTPSTARADISLFIYETDYTSEEQVFPENIIAMRDEILKTRIFGDPENPNSYLVTESQVPPSFRMMELDGHYAVEMRGQWKTHNISMGGSFVSYTVVDEAAGKLYYLEGFLYYPNESHKTALREIQAILMATKFPASKDS